MASSEDFTPTIFEIFKETHPIKISDLHKACVSFSTFHNSVHDLKLHGESFSDFITIQIMNSEKEYVSTSRMDYTFTIKIVDDTPYIYIHENGYPFAKYGYVCNSNGDPCTEDDAPMISVHLCNKNIYHYLNENRHIIYVE